MLKLPLTRLYSGPVAKPLAKLIPKSGSGFHYIYGGLTVRCKGLPVSAADYFVFSSRREKGYLSKTIQIKKVQSV